MIHLRQVGEVDFALRDDRLDRNGAFGERMRQPAGGKKTDAQQSGLRVLRRGSCQEHDLIGLLGQNGNGGQCGKEQGQPAAADQPYGSQ